MISPKYPKWKWRNQHKSRAAYLCFFYHTCFLDSVKVKPTIQTLTGSWEVERDSILIHLTTYFHIKIFFKKKLEEKRKTTGVGESGERASLKLKSSCCCCLAAKSYLTLQPHGLQPTRPPLSMWFSQARILEWVAISFSTEVMCLSVFWFISLTTLTCILNPYTSLYGLWFPCFLMKSDVISWVGIHVHKVLKSYILKVALLSWSKQILSLTYKCMNSINIWKLFEDSTQHSYRKWRHKNAFGFELQTKNLPRELAEMKVVNGDDARVSEMVHHLPRQPLYRPNLTTQRHDQDPFSNQFTVNAFLYDKIQYIKEGRWPWGCL